MGNPGSVGPRLDGADGPIWYPWRVSALFEGLVLAALAPTMVAAAPRLAAADGPPIATPELASDELNGFAYLRLGYAGRPSAPNRGGAGFGLGGRFEVGAGGLDLSLCNLTIDDEATGEMFSGAMFRFVGLWLATPARARSLYLGAGVEVLGAKGAIGRDGRLYGGEGTHAVALVGYELRRTRSFRLFGQLEGVTPLYSLTAANGDRDSRIHLYLMLSLGLGIGSAAAPAG